MVSRVVSGCAARFRFTCFLLPFLMVGCGGGGSGTSTVPEQSRVTIELSDFNESDVDESPYGNARIVRGRVLVDFADSLSSADIDSELAALDLVRVGMISGFNIVTASFATDRTESDVQTLLEALPTVDVATLVHEVIPYSTAGATQSIIASPLTESENREILSRQELFVNWPHYVMDTFPAHALADSIIGSETSQEIVMAIFDQGSFHSTGATLGEAARQSSLLTGESGDTDLAPKLVNPTGLRIDASTGQPTITVGTNRIEDNPLLKAAGNSLHGLKVASAAVGAGQHILGTGRHVGFRPVLLSKSLVVGRCELDRSEICIDNDDCPVGTGSCDQGITTLDYLIAGIAELARNLGNADAQNTRVVNMSIGLDIDDADERERVRSLAMAPFESLLAGNRVLVVAAGNDSDDTTSELPGLMGPERDGGRPSASSAIDRKMLVVGGSALPDANLFDILLEPTNPALEFDGQRERGFSGSNTGSRIHVTAPGEYVPVLRADFSTREVTDGTSFSAPYVAGIIGEMFAIDPTLTAEEAVALLEASADDLGAAGPDDTFGHGRVNAWKSLLAVVNRDQPIDDPAWLGIRIQFVASGIGPSDNIVINDQPVNDIHWRRVAFNRDSRDNTESVPNRNAFPAALAADFSVSAEEFNTQPGGILKIDIRNIGGETLYSLPVRLNDLLDNELLDASFDDYVITINVVEDTAAAYGRVVDADGSPLAGARVRYSGFDNAPELTLTDTQGYYSIDDALPNQPFDLTVSANGLVDEVTVVQIPTHQSEEFNFTLQTSPGGSDTPAGSDFGDEFPRYYRGTMTYTWEYQRIDGSASITCTGADTQSASLRITPSGSRTWSFSRNHLVKLSVADADSPPTCVQFDSTGSNFSSREGTWTDAGTLEIDFLPQHICDNVDDPDDCTFEGATMTGTFDTDSLTASYSGYRYLDYERIGVITISESLDLQRVERQGNE